MSIVESTAGCPRLPIVLFALEELGASYQLVTRPAGYFSTRDGTIGPAVVDGELRLVQLDAALRHLARREGSLLPQDPRELARCESLMELQSTWLRPAVVRLIRAGMAGVEDAEAERTVSATLGVLDGELRDRDYLLGAQLSVADCPAAIFGRLPPTLPILEPYPRLRAYVERLHRRPAWQRVEAVVAKAMAA